MPTDDTAQPGGQEPKGAPEEKLTPRQRLFVENYIKTKNGTRSAQAAGYSGTVETLAVTASQTLRIPKVQAAIQSGLQAQVERVRVSADEVIGWLKAIREKSMQEEPVLDRRGNPTGEYRYDSNGALRATELIGKHFGMWSKDNGNDGGDDQKDRRDERAKLLAVLKEPTQ